MHTSKESFMWNHPSGKIQEVISLREISQCDEITPLETRYENIVSLVNW